MASPRLNDRTVLPLFHLFGKNEEVFDVSEFKRKKNLVLFFLTAGDGNFLIKAENFYPELKNQNAELAVVFTLPQADVCQMHKKNHLTFHVLSDQDRGVFNRFIKSDIGESIAALFITDKFGEIFFQYIENNIENLPIFEDIIKSLRFIESQCPECGG